MQETLLVHKDLNKTEGLDDLLMELANEGIISHPEINYVTSVLPEVVKKRIKKL